MSSNLNSKQLSWFHGAYPKLDIKLSSNLKFNSKRTQLLGTLQAKKCTVTAPKLKVELYIVGRTPIMQNAFVSKKFGQRKWTVDNTSFTLKYLIG